MPILIANKGHTFPRTLLDAAASFGPTQWGVAVLMKDKLTLVQETAKLDANELDGYNKAYSKENFLLVLNKGKKDIPEEEQQPFTVLTLESSKDVPMLSAVVSGTYANYDGEAKFVEEFLKPKLERVFAKSGKDMAKFMKALEDEDFRELVEQVIRPNGTVALMASNGQVVFYNVNKDAVTTPFGFTTDLFGLKVESFNSAAVQKQDAKKSGLQALSDSGTPIEPDKKETPEVKPDVKEAVKEPDKKSMPDAVAQITAGEDFLWVRPKKDSGLSAVNKWYDKVCAHLGVQKTVEMVKAKPAMRVMRTFYAKQLHVSSDVVAPPPTKDAAGYQPFETVSDTALGEKIKKAQEAFEASTTKLEVMPKASEETIKFLREIIKLHSGVSDEVLQGLEKKHPNYFEVGHKWDDVSKWPFSNYLDLAEDKLAVSLLAWTLAGKLRQVERKLASQFKEVIASRGGDERKTA